MCACVRPQVDWLSPNSLSHLVTQTSTKGLLSGKVIQTCRDGRANTKMYLWVPCNEIAITWKIPAWIKPGPDWSCPTKFDHPGQRTMEYKTLTLSSLSLWYAAPWSMHSYSLSAGQVILMWYLIPPTLVKNMSKSCYRTQHVFTMAHTLMCDVISSRSFWAQGTSQTNKVSLENSHFPLNQLHSVWQEPR